MATRVHKNPLSRSQKLFRMPALYPLDANNLVVEEAMGRLFVYLRTGGRLITRTDKLIFTSDDEHAETPHAVVNAACEYEGNRFSGVDHAERRDLLSSWLESHFALMSRRGKARGGSYRMSGLRPLHFAIIKLFNPRVKRQDRYLSEFFYNALKDDPVLYSNADSLLRQFFGIGVRPYGDNDYCIDEAELVRLANDGKLDIELLFLLRLLEPFDTDKHSTRQDDRVPRFDLLCCEQIELMKQDLQLLFLYRNHVPRRELINYMITLMVFHAALYFFQIVRSANYMVATGKVPAPRGETPQPGEARTNAPFDLDLFCDMTGGHDAVVDSLSKRCYIERFREVEEYFKSAYFLKKLEEFAGSYLTQDQKQQRGQVYLQLLLTGFLNHVHLDGFFGRDIQEVRQNGYDEEADRYNPDVERIIDVSNRRGLNKLQTFVEILYHFQHKTLRDQHRKLIAGLCGTELDRGFMAGKGRARRKLRHRQRVARGADSARSS